MHKSFEEMKKTWRDKKALLERYAKSYNGDLVERSSNDGWDIVVQILDHCASPNHSLRAIMFESVGTNFPEVYDELLTTVMHSHGWNAVEEMKVWIDLNQCQ